MTNDKRKKDAPTPTETSSNTNSSTPNNNPKQSKSQGGKQNIKKRNWAFVVYPESAPSDWIEQLQKTGLQCAISPLHDKDIDPTGNQKKSHYHVIAIYNGPTSYNVVKKITDSFNAPIPQTLEQVRGYYRYLTHKDNPDKYQYSEDDIKTINGFNISDFAELSKSEVNEIRRKLQMLIREKGIIEYSSLIDYLLDENKLVEHEVACNNTYFFDKYITSKRHSIEKPIKIIKIDVETGEVLEEQN